ncbi:TlpA disulfide reductase family protein [Pseudoalteromonas luteoviolacea]|uniref:Thioredoxin domain-containing protein n=1 Tax=Pseudoalteromonas luteoviolacea S4060-1 TaxID=1365257 RepID=A0A167J0T0_9GAMM|nr:TlpA disulfide reductase family protein [Pseudoalteromonas luteoviolacea]KZN60348.1 hypothetical protein N478_07265 [Pseudoalteromonas luteoviolacea S4060-1]
MLNKFLLLLWALCFTASTQAAITHFSNEQIIGLNKQGTPVVRSLDTPTVVTFWASWCPYCKKILPLLEGLQRKLGTDKIRIIVVNTREEGALRQTRRTYKKLVKQFEKKGLQLEFVFDKKHALYNTLNKPGLPYTMVIDKQGKITYAQAGYSEQIAQPMLAAIQAVLSDGSTAKH